MGRQNIPLDQEGDAMFHIANFDELSEVAEHIEQLQENVIPEGEVIVD